jgi:dihydrodipicolinate synthase/N-acetylneuraminate lyase
MFNPLQEVAQQQMVVMKPLVLGQASLACAQSSAASTTAQQYPVDTITSITPYLFALSGKQSWKDKGSCQGLGASS